MPFLLSNQQRQSTEGKSTGRDKSLTWPYLKIFNLILVQIMNNKKRKQIRTKMPRAIAENSKNIGNTLCLTLRSLNVCSSSFKVISKDIQQKVSLVWTVENHGKLSLHACALFGCILHENKNKYVNDTQCQHLASVQQCSFLFVCFAEMLLLIITDFNLVFFYFATLYTYRLVCRNFHLDEIYEYLLVKLVIQKKALIQN